MGLMDSAMQSDAEFTADTDQWSEEGYYTPKATGVEVTVRVIIDREEPNRDEVANYSTRYFRVWMPYSSDYGLTSEPAKGDKLRIKRSPSDATAVDANNTLSFRSIESEDAGGWVCMFA